MGWEYRNQGRGRYYYRSGCVNGRKFHLYFGTGPEAEAAAVVDERRRAERAVLQNALQTAQARWQEAVEPAVDLIDASEALLQAALGAAGFQQHDRGEWRLRCYE